MPQDCHEKRLNRVIDRCKGKLLPWRKTDGSNFKPSISGVKPKYSPLSNFGLKTQIALLFGIKRFSLEVISRIFCVLALAPARKFESLLPLLESPRIEFFAYYWFILSVRDLDAESQFSFYLPIILVKKWILRKSLEVTKRFFATTFKVMHITFCFISDLGLNTHLQSWFSSSRSSCLPLTFSFVVTNLNGDRLLARLNFYYHKLWCSFSISCLISSSLFYLSTNVWEHITSLQFSYIEISSVQLASRCFY